MLDQLIPRQRRMTTRLGGFLVLMSETMFLFSILNFLMISRLQYYNSGDSYIRAVFPHYLLFLGAMGTTGLAAMWVISYMSCRASNVSLRNRQLRISGVRLMIESLKYRMNLRKCGK